MGTAVRYRTLPDRQPVYRLMIYCIQPPELVSTAVSMNRALAAELVRWRPERRSVQLENCFLKLLRELPERAAVRDIDVMFHPEYKVDVMKILVSAYKSRPFSLIWPGTYSDGRLIYSEEQYPDYKVYKVDEYDIMCII